VACEDLLKVYSKILGIRLITIRPFSLYGKYENPQRIGPLVLDSLARGLPLELTAGEQIRDYMDVCDLADAIYSLIINEKKLKDGDVFNICSGSQISLKNFILIIADAFNLDKTLLLFGRKQYRQNESLFFAGNNAKLLGVIGEKDYKISTNKVFAAYKEYLKNNNANQ
jgi:dTDP-6-deoxy-L-talose 4-dehydrogenase (NAD+)